MGLPAKLTDEEQKLLENYALLKKMKKQLQEKQAAANVESQKSTQAAKKAEGKDVVRAPSDAKELAKRKILSGELKIKKDNGQREFKRARSHNEKRPDGHEKIKLDDIESNSIRGDSEKSQLKPPGRNYDIRFVPGGRLQDSSQEKQDQPRQKFMDRGKKKIYVSGYGLTEAILQNEFTKFGSIQNVHSELSRGQGFITFATHEAAEKAIAEMHGEMIQNVTLKVHMAGRPNRRDDYHERRPSNDRRERFHPGTNAAGNKEPSSQADASASNQDAKKPPDRNLVSYAEDFDF